MAIQFYQHDDDGVPAYGTSTTGLPSFGIFKIIVKACLVTGYGEKPPAGWELIAEGERYLVLRTGNHSGFVAFEYSGDGAIIWLSQTFSGMSGNRMTGDGLKSGIAAANGSVHFKSLRYIASGAANRRSWVVAADHKTAIFNFAVTNAGTDQEIVGSNGADGTGLLYFGEDAASNLIACGGATDALPWGYFDQRAFTALKNPATGLLVDTGSISPLVVPSQTSMSGVGGRLNAYAGVLSEAIFTPASWGADGVFVRLRGVCADARVAALCPHAAARALGLASGLTFGTINTPLPTGDGHNYWIGGAAATAAQSGVTLIMTTNPEFW